MARPRDFIAGFARGPSLVHFKWMREYGIDGVFLSRFVSETTSPRAPGTSTWILANVREGCHREGRVWAMMLDLSTGRRGSTAIVINDWKFLCDKVKVREDSRYLHHHGKPVVLLWGLGFKDRPWTAEQGEELVQFFKSDSQYGGVYLIGGVDPYWRTLRGGSRPQPEWAKVYRMFDAISPWDAGRYRDDAGMDRVRKEVWEPDLAELTELKIGYMPTAFPGFSVGQPTSNKARDDHDRPAQGGVLLAAVRDLPIAGNSHSLRGDVRRGERGDGDLQGVEPDPGRTSTS